MGWELVYCPLKRREQIRVIKSISSFDVSCLNFAQLCWKIWRQEVSVFWLSKDTLLNRNATYLFYCRREFWIIDSALES